ncbi:hypothetical protein [Cohnella mopanensis]|uniref:hypothetical protein n=1 Tax=Cohnella mopanensis TaxID=2911966 RepID=UPI001EF8B197|nr:hypothetical protein [Cohnella mopanensis]
MRDAALLAIWLIGLFSLIGCVLTAVARFVRKDSMKYDRQFTWWAFRNWDGDRTKNTISESKLEDM